MDIKNNISAVFRAVKHAAQQVGRSSEAVNIIAVTKYVDSSVVSKLVEAGITHIGENRVDKFLEKYAKLNDSHLTWHLIGTLQRRKVKDVINFVDYFHALDSIKLAQEINKRADKPIKCFLQLNISGETNKHGFAVSEIEEVLLQLALFEKIELVGLMTMAPIDADKEELTFIFSKMKSLQLELSQRSLPRMPFTELSMGMSGDFTEAIANGSTFVRIGSAFFE